MLRVWYAASNATHAQVRRIWYMCCISQTQHTRTAMACLKTHTILSWNALKQKSTYNIVNLTWRSVRLMNLSMNLPPNDEWQQEKFMHKCQKIWNKVDYQRSKKKKKRDQNTSSQTTSTTVRLSLENWVYPENLYAASYHNKSSPLNILLLFRRAVFPLLIF